MPRMGTRLALLLLLVVAACGPSVSGADDDVGGDDEQVPDIDAMRSPDARRSPDSGIAYPDAEPYDDGGNCSNWECANPVDDHCNPGGGDECNNGTDEDCDGNIDEGCSCQSGAVQACFRGPPGRRNVGACVDGTQRCTGSGEFTYWGPCEGGITPVSDACDSQDNDCNGCADDNPACCVVELQCPGPGDLPEGQPFADYIIDGTQFYSGAVTSWSWTVTGGPCDQMFVGIGQLPSYTLAGANTSTLTFRPKLSGDYTVHLTIVAADGTVYECTFIVHIAGPGLRVELCWDTAGSTDIDLHVHRPNTTTNWFTTGLGNNNDDCFYANCKVGGNINWGYASTPVAQCDPAGQLGWTGFCRNPRLDVDNISLQSRPENINVDVPEADQKYRVMVHFYSGTALTHPIVNIYCGGYLRATYGAAPDQLQGFDDSGGYNAGEMWRVVDVAPIMSGSETTDCTLTPLHPPGQMTGYWLTNDVSTY
jgi:hypothetical protein